MAKHLYRVVATQLMLAIVVALVAHGCATTASTTRGAPVSTLTSVAAESGPPSADAVQVIVANANPSIVTVVVSSLLSSPSGEEQPYQEVGAGVVYSADGLILAPSLLVAPAGKPDQLLSMTRSVTFAFGETAPATLVGVDASSGVGVIKVQKSDLHPAVFGGAPKIADWVIIIARGASDSAGTARVDALDAQLPTSPPLTGLLHIGGAPIPGAGAVIDRQGNLLGLLVGYDPSHYAGLAIPADVLVAGAQRVSGE
jgi:S1-C subfamily serine protease